MRTVVIGLTAGLAFFSTAFAQDDAVVITAPRFPEDVRRLPASVTVITREDIDRSAARTIPELLNAEVGLNSRDLFGNNAAQATVDLRGFGATGAQNTLILLDGRRLNDLDLSGVQWPAIPIASIERIEIVRGSGSVLYGDNASAGIVNIVTRSPLTPGNAAEVFGRTASYQTLEGQLYGSHATDAYGINGSIHGYRSNGYRHNNRNEQANATLNSRLAVGNGSLDLRLGADSQELRLPGARRIQPSIGLDEYAADPRGAQTPLDFAYRDGFRAGTSLAQRFGDAELVVGLDYRGKKTLSYFDQNGFPSTRDDTLDLTSFTPRLRLPFNLASIGNTLVVGVDWHDWRYRSTRADTQGNLSQPSNRVAVDQNTLGFYAQDTLLLTRDTIAVLGWREERAKYSADDVADPTSPACPFGCGPAPSVRETQTVHAWEAGLRHNVTPNLTPFVRANRSYRLVNAEEIYEFDAGFAPQFQILRPQRALTYEIGIGWRRQVDAARITLFRSDVDDEIHLDPFTAGVGNFNLPPSRRQGVELDGAWQPAKPLRLNATYAYTDAKFREGSFQGAGGDTSIAGKNVPLVPRHKATLGGSWDLLAKTRFSALFTAASKQYLDNDETNTLGQYIPSYRVLDLKLAQTVGPARIAFVVNNALNQKYYTYAVKSNNPATPDRYAVYPLPGISYGLTAELRL
jgi:iron complex outermembrane receptor protein